MPSPFTHLPILALLLTTPISSADLLGGSHDTSPGGSGPYNVPLPKFNTLMSSPNATSTFSLSLPDVSLPYPGASSGAGSAWSWTVSVLADVPLSSSNDSSMQTSYPNKTFTANSLFLKAPLFPNGTAAIDPSWLVCVLNFEIAMGKYPSKWRQDDGSCSSVLSSSCRQGLESNAVQFFRSSSRYKEACRCPDYENVQGCSGEDLAPFKAESICIARAFNASTINKWPDGKFDVIRYGSEPHAPGNRTVYDLTGSITWPVMVMCSPSANASSNAKGSAEIPESPAKMMCVRAKEATAGSVVPGSASSAAGKAWSRARPLLAVMAPVWIGCWVVV